MYTVSAFRSILARIALIESGQYGLKIVFRFIRKNEVKIIHTTNLTVFIATLYFIVYTNSRVVATYYCFRHI